MKAWSSAVDELFHGDPRFWRSVAASVTGLLALVAATVLTALVGVAALAAYVAPAVLLAVAAVAAHRSSATTRAHFGSRREWRDAERRAVAAALVPRRRTTVAP